MGSIFPSLQRTLLAGIALLVLVLVLSGIFTGQFVKPDHAWLAFVMRWLHVLCGVMWIGLLWYLNFVQVPNMPNIPEAQRPAITKVIAPAVLFYFRYAALATVITGLLLAIMNGYLLQALMLKTGHHAIGIGMWLALIMAFNVWFLIWPNQQKVLGLVDATAEEKAAAGRVALYASRFNTMASITMLYCMVAQQNGGL
ncbi:MAG: hypothetical protein EXR05_11660 [Acetobacteraceae bacterium]|nr:hypothetical protein [Acetobacteraceae bacterium]MSP30420.1 hypothetical protein [Acetobacteraceae bacterium]